MFLYKPHQLKKLNQIFFSCRFNSVLSNLEQKPLPQSFTNDEKPKQQLGYGRNSLTWSDSSDNVLILPDTKLELTISKKFHEPLLSIDQISLVDQFKNSFAKSNSRQKSDDFIQMGLSQAHLLIQRIYKLAALKFQIDKSITLLSMDRWKETLLESGLLQQLYTYRVPGMLYGENQSIIYLNVLRFKTLRHSEDRSKHKSSGKSAIFDQQITKQPLIYISQHMLLPNIYHLWTPVVKTIEVPIDKILELACRMDVFIANFNGDIGFELDEYSNVKQAQKPLFDLNNKDPISYFATPIETPSFVKKITSSRSRPHNIDIDKRHEKHEFYDRTNRSISVFIFSQLIK
ncbi:hypothetical protein Mgra_00004732 [Meloidogyne graminicola]|uniref:Uncharacterized protein n=1 Tax=Meloidogyne graminicola TaxID=189291 RepID=A0A8S9ZQX0_9BILA|nr:hypothetical protein Mgra_00004732 [Meloidogyne graminicola]